MYKVYISIITLLFISCSSEPSDSEENLATTTQPSFNVEYAGALKKIMHEGDISAKANLSDLKDKEHLYAIGALENLKGEIQIFDGQAFNTLVEDSLMVFDYSFERSATLLVYTEVNEWKSFEIPAKVTTMEQLQDFVASSAEKNGIDINAPFPFLIGGTASSVNWHVINWKDGDTEHSHEKHVTSGLHDTLINEDVDLLGFYSNSHHAIFTHHTTNMHIHVKTKSNEIAGHVDDLTLGSGMTLMLPVAND